MTYQIGSELPNGALVILASSDYVLCKFGSEFVTWAWDQQTGDCYWGHYFKDLTTAIAEFTCRVEGI